MVVERTSISANGELDDQVLGSAGVPTSSGFNPRPARAQASRDQDSAVTRTQWQDNPDLYISNWLRE
jgi:hypothetical protein